jgi:hypothetical protein
MRIARKIAVCIALIGTAGSSLSSSIEVTDPTVADSTSLAVMKRKVHNWDGVNKMDNPILGVNKMDNPILGVNKMDNPILSPLEL